MSSVWRTVFVKEVVENARDRRVMMSALLFGPLFGPVLFGVMLFFMLSQAESQRSAALELPVAGAENAPTLIAFLEAQNVEIVAAPDDPVAAIREQQVDMVLEVSPAYAEAWRAGRPAPLALRFDGSRQTTRIPVERARGLIGAYGQTTASQRLRLRGIDGAVTEPVRLRMRDQATDQARAGTILTMLPYLVLLSAFIGGMYLAIDTTAGERERGSLEPLFLSPAGRGELLAGKLLATTLYSAASLLISTAAFGASIALVPAGRLGIDLSIPLVALLQIALVAAPVALLAAAAQTLIASFARSFREAQTYVQFLMIIPIVPTLVMAVNPVSGELWMYATPLLSQSLMIVELARGEPAVALHFVLSIASTVLAAAGCGMAGWMMFRRESFVLST